MNTYQIKLRFRSTPLQIQADLLYVDNHSNLIAVVWVELPVQRIESPTTGYKTVFAALASEWRYAYKVNNG